MVEEFQKPAVAADPTFQYLTGQLNPRQPALLAELQRRSVEAVNALRPALDLPYGAHPRQRFDFFKTSWTEATFAYFHAGYWQARDKSQFRFIAPAFAEAGFNVALVNYPLCPDATLKALTEAVRAFVPVVRGLEGVVGLPLIAAGHSAGAHLAVELALTDWPARGVPANAISGVAAFSGIYNLEPLIVTPINDNLRLDVPAARAVSPNSPRARRIATSAVCCGGVGDAGVPGPERRDVRRLGELRQFRLDARRRRRRPLQFVERSDRAWRAAVRRGHSARPKFRTLRRQV